MAGGTWPVHFLPANMPALAQGKAAGFSAPGGPTCERGQRPSITDLYIGLTASLCPETGGIGGVGIFPSSSLSLDQGRPPPLRHN